jgi:hypothetical protein
MLMLQCFNAEKAWLQTSITLQQQLRRQQVPACTQRLALQQQQRMRL